jgi:hypothetical protein
MARQVRYRVAALALGGFLLGAPLLINGTASADQVEGGGRQVVFDGAGGLSLSCRSRPAVGSMLVPADSTIRLVNHTGRDARLRLGGTLKGTIRKNGSTEVVFRRGTTAVVLSPSCPLGDTSTPLLVTAAPASVAATPVSTVSSSAVTPLADSDPAPAGVAGSALSDQVAAPRGMTGRRPATLGARGSADGRTTTTRDGSASRINTRLLRGTGAATPAYPGRSAGDPGTVGTAVPPLSPSPTAHAGAAAPGAAMTEAAAEPVTSMPPVSQSGPDGLLALTAIVCVTGVAFGAIRAFVSQRAFRTTITYAGRE